MKIEILCDNCRRSFKGDECLADSTGEVLCPNCVNDFDDEIEDDEDAI